MRWPSTQTPVHFNPRSREGSDTGRKSYQIQPTYFNPRSREGSDTGRKSYQIQPTYFNPRSREGSDSKHSQSLACLYLLQHILQDFASIRHIQNAENGKKSKVRVRTFR